MNSNYKVSGNIVDLHQKKIYKGTVHIRHGTIDKIVEENTDSDIYILPGLIDAHIHIESSMLIPSEFARLAVVHGTVATVSDPHEIANVLGIQGIEYMIENGKKVPFKFYFGASSCVPATTFETAGDALGVEEIDKLLSYDEVKYLSEMMNWPGVIYGDPEVAKKLETAKKHNKPVDGHAPGLNGEDAKKYIDAGITTDHECFTKEEAFDKLKHGMKILIREGSAAKNFDELIGLLKDYPQQIMFCSDDRHPNDLVGAHIDDHVKRAIKKGFDPFTVLRVASLNPVSHYKLDVGLLRTGDDADFITVDNLEDFNVLTTYIKGEKVAENGNSLINSVSEKTPNNFNITEIDPNDLSIKSEKRNIRVIEALDGQLITNELEIEAKKDAEGNLVSDVENDVLKIVVVNRYQKTRPSIGFVKNFGLKEGAIASSVAHDSHNIVAVGTKDKDLAQAINLIIKSGGGVSAVAGSKAKLLELPVAGIMTNGDGYETAGKYETLDKMAKQMGSQLNAPYMTLSFMALLVIPNLKMSDKGLFNGQKFEFTTLGANN
ncbi:MAG: adenine deaminase [Bacteroidales bacterium]|nr:adenine deaminase [Bacteroidales bacterium]MCF8343256.1 adenine deaminase [Bacteroidales bacterium]MCF8352541.1 adenine deaminase [Bacteroidales bacterium]MCF8376434.1 adenine deaminase [Bacteroidales bacterium]MCF8400553.1 adenine deaminase [Bacteroidales bacterium]